MKNILTKENITFFIALISFLLSLFNFISILIANRKHIKLTYKIHHECPTFNEHPIFFELIIENLSKLDISVSRMFLIVGEVSYEFSSLPEFVYETTQRTGSTITDRKTYYSNSLPQTIKGLGVLGGFFWVNTCNAFNYNNLYTSDVSLCLYTNRGKSTFPIICKRNS